MLCGSRIGIRSIQAFGMLKWIRVNGERGSRPEGRAHFICEYSHDSRFIKFLSKEWELRSLAGPDHRTGLRSMHLSVLAPSGGASCCAIVLCVQNSFTCPGFKHCASVFDFLISDRSSLDLWLAAIDGKSEWRWGCVSKLYIEGIN